MNLYFAPYFYILENTSGMLIDKLGKSGVCKGCANIRNNYLKLPGTIINRLKLSYLDTSNSLLFLILKFIFKHFIRGFFFKLLNS